MKSNEMDYGVNKYIVASNKSWNKSFYNRLLKSSDGYWLYVKNESELNKALRSEIPPRYIFFIHWSHIVSKEIWSVHECICFHMTDLPYGRGGSPLQNLILDGKTKTKLSALQMTREIDAGPVYYKRVVKLNGSAEEVYTRISKICFEMIPRIIKRQPTPMPQTGIVTKFKRRKPHESALPKKGGAKEIYDFIRMLDAPGYPSAFINYGEFLIKFSKAKNNGSNVEVSAVIQNRGKKGE